MIDAALISSAAVEAAFQCTADAPLMLGGAQSAPVLTEVGLPPEAQKRSFDVRITQTNGLPTVEVAWPGDYMRLAENVTPAFETAEGSYAFTGFSVGPCLFTDKGCTSQFSIVDRAQGNGSADLLIVPVALGTDEKTGKKSSMTVVMRGVCQRTDIKK